MTVSFHTLPGSGDMDSISKVSNAVVHQNGLSIFFNSKPKYKPYGSEQSNLKIFFPFKNKCFVLNVFKLN